MPRTQGSVARETVCRGRTPPHREEVFVLPEVIRAFRDELQKIAVTRSVKEWRAAQGAGDAGTAGQIAGASHQLGLKPRYLKDISTGGEEAGVDLMMGHKAGPTGETNEGGLLARKLYK